ncbi:MAG: hypothetical protein H6621_01835 [Halobacteriovoraceae bacterium]|nr:hypothetical protein [Halobacteriovoraceae bacterium]
MNKYILFFILTFQAMAQEMVINRVGEYTEPHILVQMRSDEQARGFLANQIYDIVKALKPKGNFFENKLKLQRNELLALLTAKAMKSQVSDTIEEILFFKLGHAEELDNSYVKKVLKGEEDFSKDRRFKNKLALNIKLNDLEYKINPEGIVISDIDSEVVGQSLFLDLKLELSKIYVRSNDTCISFSVFGEQAKSDGGWEIVKKDSRYFCEKADLMKLKMNQFIESLVQDKKMNINIEKVKNQLGDLEYFRDLGAKVGGIEAYTREVAPLALNIRLKLSLLNGELNLQVEQGSIDQLIADLTPRELQDSVDIKFLSGKAADINGLAGLIIQSSPIKFDDTFINSALGERKSDLIKLLVTPIANDLEKIVDQMSQRGFTRYHLSLGGNIKIRELGQIHYKLSSLSLINTGTEREQLVTGVDIKFGDKEKEKVVQEYNYRKLIGELENEIGVYGGERKADVVVSIGENLFNDFLKYALGQFQEQIDKTVFNPSDVQFNFADLPFDEIDAEDGELSLHNGYLQACTAIVPKKGIQKFLIKLVLGKKGVHVPVVALTEIRLQFNDKGIPELIFDIPQILSSRQLLENGFNACQISKRFKKIVSKVASKKIDELYNGFSDIPLLKVTMHPIGALNGELLKMKVDKENKRINFLLSLKETESINNEFLKKVRIENKKFEVTFPKLEAMKK